MNWKFRFSFAFALLFFNGLIAGNWPGHAILGNGRLCGVYSDDPRITSKDGFGGIRHLYFNDFTADYIRSSKFEIYNDLGKIPTDSSSTTLADFYTVNSSFFRDGEPIFSGFVRAGSYNGLIFQCNNSGRESWPVFTINFNAVASPDGKVKLTEVRALKNGNLFVSWSNNVFFVLYSNAAVDIYKKSNSVVELHFSQNKAPQVEVFLLVGNNEKKLIERADSLNHTNGLWADAGKFWEAWIGKGQLPYPKAKDSVQQLYNEYYSRNIYATFCSNLYGQVPADITGQLITGGLPQLFPRNAMMVARSLLACGYPESASQIIRFWTSQQIPFKKRGEFYARYNAQCQAVDAGSGVRFDQPEWDAGGYLICLLHDYYLKFGSLLADTSLVYDLADFLTISIDSQGLLYEGGIVEWTGYLPATNMIASAGLMSAAEFADKFDRPELHLKYTNAWKTISAHLPSLFDTTRQSYAARRYWTDKSEGFLNIFRIKGKLVYLWDATTVYGVLWGYPDHDLMRLSYDFTWENLTDRAGVMNFEAGDKSSLAAYGSDLFIYTTAAHAEYAVKQHLPVRAAGHINWMIANSNIYGLMPERILSDYSQCSDTSPYTWSCAEFAASVKLYAKTW
jgi:GH15 family glucan-1,4-alpha-glucosidase